MKALRKEFADARAEMRQFNEQTLKAATGVKNIEQAAKPAAGALGGFFKQFAAATVVGNMVTGALFRAKQAIVSFATGSIQASSSLTELNSKATVVFGDTFKKVQLQSKAVALEVGRASSAILQMATDFGAIIKAFGVTGPLMDDMSVRLAKLAVDMASFHNTSDENAFMALRSGLSGETEPLKRFGIVLTDVNLKLFALEKGLKGKVEQMNQAQKTALRYEFIMAKTADAQGDAARTADSYANQTRRLSGEITTLQEEMGKSVTPGLADALKVLSGAIQTTRVFTKALLQDLGSIAEAIELKMFKSGVTKQSALKGMKLDFLADPNAKAQDSLMTRLGNRLDAEKRGEETAELNARMNALDGFGELGGGISLGGAGAAGKAAQDREKALSDLMQALSEQAKARSERLKARREELKLRERLGILTKEESRELATINRRVDYQEDKVQDLMKAWEGANDRVKTMRETVNDLNADVIRQRQELDQTLSGIDERTAQRRKEKIAELIREQNEIREKATGAFGMTGDMSRRLGEIDAQLGGVPESERVAGAAIANQTDLQQIDSAGEADKKAAALEANRKLDETLGDLALANLQLTAAEAARAEALKAVTTAVEEMGEKQEVQFQGVEEATRVHVANQTAELIRLGGQIRAVEEAYKSAAAAARDFASSSGTANEAGPPAGHRAGGGTIYGPGGIDKVNTWLTAGEEVINKAAAQRYRPLLKAINSFSLPAPHFATGGTVQTFNQQRDVQVHQTFNHSAMSSPLMHRWLARFAHQ